MSRFLTLLFSTLLFWPHIVEAQSPTPSATPTLTDTPGQCETFTAIAATATATRTATPVAPCPECGPTPVAEQCLRAWGQCTPNGTWSPNLGLCKPHRGDFPWLFAVNSDQDLESWLFPECVLEVAHGGTGLAGAATAGDLLVGTSAGAYARLPAVAGSALTAEGGVPAWALAPMEVHNSPPPLADCDEDAEFGRLAFDASFLRLCVCEGQALHWKCVATND